MRNAEMEKNELVKTSVDLLQKKILRRSITAVIKNQMQGEIKLEFFRQENEFHLTYSDNGSGIEAAILPKVFDAFFTTGRSQGCLKH